MNSQPIPTSEPIPDLLRRQQFYDGLAGNQAGALLFLLAAQTPDTPYFSIDLGIALVKAEDAPQGQGLFKPLRAMRQVDRLCAAGYMAASAPDFSQRRPRTSDTFNFDDHFARVTTKFLPYKKTLATTLLGLELDFPDMHEARVMGISQLWNGRPETPSLNLIVYETLLDSGQEILLPLASQKIKNRLYGLKTADIVQEAGPDAVRLRPDLLPFITELVKRMRLLHEAAGNPAYHQAAEDMAKEILGSPAAIRTLLSKRIQLPRQPRSPKPEAVPAPAIIHTVAPPPVALTEKPAPQPIVPSGIYPANWISQGACNDADPELFTIESGDSAKISDNKIREAQKYCEPCSVAGACLKSALLAKDEHSIAFLSPAQRDTLTRDQIQEVIDTVIIERRSR